MRFIIIVAALLFSSVSFSADYYWFLQGAPTVKHLSPSSACTAFFAAFVPYAGYSKGPSRVLKLSVTNYQCQIDEINSIGSIGGTSTRMVNRAGDTCPAGSIYNSVTGVCDAPQPDPCESQTGFINHQNKTYLLDGSTPRAEPPAIICQSACQYTFTQEAPNNCYRFADGTSPNGGFCSYKYKGNGTSCTDGPTKPPGSLFDQPPTKPPIDRTPSLFDSLDCAASVTDSATGAKSQTCVSKTEYVKPGGLNCADLASPASSSPSPCTSGTPKPEYKKETVTIDNMDSSNPDGSTSSTSTKTTETTTCSGVNSCNTTTTTSTTTSGKNADGSDKPSSTDCNGEGCTPAKDPNNTEGDEKEQEPRVATGGGSCDASPACSGDAIDCAVLAEVNKARCDAEEAGDFPKHEADIKGLFSGAQFQAGDDELVSAPSFINSGARFLPSACPADANINLNFVGGHSFALSYSPFCFLAESLAPLILIAASVFAALYVGRSFGGE